MLYLIRFRWFSLPDHYHFWSAANNVVPTLMMTNERSNEVSIQVDLYCSCLGFCKGFSVFLLVLSFWVLLGIGSILSFAGHSILQPILHFARGWILLSILSFVSFSCCLDWDCRDFLFFYCRDGVRRDFLFIYCRDGVRRDFLFFYCRDGVRRDFLFFYCRDGDRRNFLWNVELW